MTMDPLDEARNHLRDLAPHIKERKSAQLMEELLNRCLSTEGKLMLTHDNVRVVPGVDPIWINPNEPGAWPHDQYYWADKHHPPVEVKRWAWHGDHIWLQSLEDDGADDHFFGKRYSTADAAIADRPDYGKSDSEEAVNDKLEIGPDPKFCRPDWDTLNVSMPCNAGSTWRGMWGEYQLPIPDERYSRIMAAHVLEHVPWFKTVEALKDAHRILKPGGTIEIWVPNFEYIVDCYKQKKHGDAWRRFNAESNYMKWVNGRIFTYGPDPNWHKATFDFEHLMGCLVDAGFTDVKRLTQDERTFPRESHGKMELGVLALKA